MIRKNNRSLYESIMRDVSKIVKKHLNENYNNKINLVIDNSGSIYSYEDEYYETIYAVIEDLKMQNINFVDLYFMSDELSYPINLYLDKDTKDILQIILNNKAKTGGSNLDDVLIKLSKQNTIIITDNDSLLCSRIINNKEVNTNIKNNVKFILFDDYDNDYLYQRYYQKYNIVSYKDV